MRLLLFLITGCSAFFVVACGEDAPSNGRPSSAATRAPEAVPTTDVTETAAAGPPDLSLEMGESSIAAGAGTYCWSGTGRGVCVDAV